MFWSLKFTKIYSSGNKFLRQYFHMVQKSNQVKLGKTSINPLPLHFIPKSRKLDMLESVEIKKALHYKQNILNNQLDIKNLPIIDILINDI